MRACEVFPDVQIEEPLDIWATEIKLISFELVSDPHLLFHLQKMFK